MDLPGIYSLSPYTLEEVVARNYLIQERPDVILNIIDGTNLERNLYLTTQLTELGIPVVIAINMMDVVKKGVLVEYLLKESLEDKSYYDTFFSHKEDYVAPIKIRRTERYDFRRDCLGGYSIVIVWKIRTGDRPDRPQQA